MTQSQLCERPRQPTFQLKSLPSTKLMVSQLVCFQHCNYLIITTFNSSVYWIVDCCNFVLHNFSMSHISCRKHLEERIVIWLPHVNSNINPYCLSQPHFLTRNPRNVLVTKWRRLIVVCGPVSIANVMVHASLSKKSHHRPHQMNCIKPSDLLQHCSTADGLLDN